MPSAPLCEKCGLGLDRRQSSHGADHGSLPLGPCVIVRLLPVEGGEPHYRVRTSFDGLRGRSGTSDQATRATADNVEVPPAPHVRRR